MNLPALHGNWIDLIIILIFTFYLLGGWNRGFVLGFVDLGGFLLSFISALKFYAFFGSLLVLNFSIPRGIANAVGFLLCGMLAEMFFFFLIKILIRKIYPHLIMKLKDGKTINFLPRLDKWFGFIPILGEATIFIAFILTLLIALPIQGAVKKSIISSKLGGPLVARTQTVERQLNSIFGEAVNETLSFLTVNPNPNSEEKVDLGFNQNQITVDEKGEEIMLTLINQERVKAGLSQLTFSTKLQEVARNHAKDMFAHGFFSHYNPEGQSPFDRMDKKGIKYGAAGENLALAPNVYLAHQGLMNSPGHRANILNADFGKVGVGIIDGGIYGEMFVQEFTD